MFFFRFLFFLKLIHMRLCIFYILYLRYKNKVIRKTNKRRFYEHLNENVK